MMQADLIPWLVLLRALMLIAIAWVIGSYHDPGARHRGCISVLAALFAGMSLAWAFHSVYALYDSSVSAVSTELWPTALVLVGLLIVIRNRGNVARMLPRVVLIRLFRFVGAPKQ